MCQVGVHLHVDGLARHGVLGGGREAEHGLVDEEAGHHGEQHQHGHGQQLQQAARRLARLRLAPPPRERRGPAARDAAGASLVSLQQVILVRHYCTRFLRLKPKYPFYTLRGKSYKTCLIRNQLQ